MYVYKDQSTLEEQKDGAYWERNMLALLCAHAFNNVLDTAEEMGLATPSSKRSGWYYDTENNWEGWKRVISLDGGRYGLHIPDTFDVGNLPQIEPNWDRHSTEEKWLRVMELFGITE